MTAQPIRFPLDRSQIQANIVKPLGEKVAAYCFLNIQDPVAFRRFLRDNADRITMESANDKSRAMLLGFTASGIQVLAPDLLPIFPEAFAQGMANRAESIGDVRSDYGDRLQDPARVRTSDPRDWDVGFGTGEIHAVIGLLSCDPSDDRSGNWTIPSGAHLVARCDGQVIATNGERQEPFGFRDGLSQPVLMEAELPEPVQDADYNRVAAGEFILGYPDELELLHHKTARARGATWEPSPVHPLLLNGSFMVFRKLRQDVDRFQRLADAHDLMGRWKSGHPADGPDKGPNPIAPFDFKNAATGVRRDSHIRRAHPRLDPTRRTESVKRHRLVRRGIPYRENKSVGLLFICYNARIEDQFEFIQSVWLNGGNASGGKSDAKDAIGSSHSDYVTVEGGEYFFVPSRAAIRRLSGGSMSAESHDLFDVSQEFAGELMVRGVIARRVPGSDLNLYFVGQYDLVKSVFQDPSGWFDTAPYADRIAEALGGQGAFMVGLQRDDSTRKSRRSLMEAMFRQGMSVAQVQAECELEMQKLLTAGSPGQAIEAVQQIGAMLSMRVFVGKYLGIPAPTLGKASKMRVAAWFARRNFGEVDPAWAEGFWRKEAEREHGAPDTENLRFWIRTGFLNTFCNPHAMTDLREICAGAGKELYEHVARILPAALGGQIQLERGSLLELGINHIRTLPRQEQPAHLNELGLLILELAGGGVETTIAGISLILDHLLENPVAMQCASAAVAQGKPGDLDAVIDECLRLAPVQTLSLRRCISDQAKIGSEPIEKGSIVCLIVPIACLDPRHFQDSDPRMFDPNRTPRNDLGFGSVPHNGTRATHACVGEWLAKAQIRAVLRTILAGYRLQRAAGPQGRLVRRYELPHSLYVRIEP